MTLHMTCDQLESLLPQLVDDETSASAMTPAVRAHLDGCAECAALLDDLQRIRSAAASLPVLTPSRDLWSGIAARIEAPVVPLLEGMPMHRPRRTVSWRSVGIAASVLLLANVAVGYEFVRRGRIAATQARDAVDSAPLISRAVGTPDSSLGAFDALATETSPTFAGAPTVSFAAIQQEPQPRQREQAKVVYDREISRLRAILDSGRHKIDPATLSQLDRNLKLIDSAIVQCQEALQRDAASPFLIESLNNAYQTKVKLLRIAAAAASRG